MRKLFRFPCTHWHSFLVRLPALALWPVQWKSERVGGGVYQPWSWQETRYQLCPWYCKRNAYEVSFINVLFQFHKQFSCLGRCLQQVPRLPWVMTPPWPTLAPPCLTVSRTFTWLTNRGGPRPGRGTIRMRSISSSRRSQARATGTLSLPIKLSWEIFPRSGDTPPTQHSHNEANGVGVWGRKLGTEEARDQRPGHKAQVQQDRHRVTRALRPGARILQS